MSLWSCLPRGLDSRPGPFGVCVCVRALCGGWMLLECRKGACRSQLLDA